MCQRRIGYDREAGIPARLPQRKPVPGVMVRQEHMGEGIVAQAIARCEDEQTMTENGDEDGIPDAARHHAGWISTLGISIRLGLARFSRARLKACRYFRQVS